MSGPRQAVRTAGGGLTGATARGAALLTGSGHAAAWLLVTVLALAAAVLTGIVCNELATSDALSNLGGALAEVWYATLGALVVRRTGNVVGWVLLAAAASLGIVSLASAYAVEGITHPGTFPAPDAGSAFRPGAALTGSDGVPNCVTLTEHLACLSDNQLKLSPREEEGCQLGA